MNDPLDQLQDFYEACENAPLPPSLTRPMPTAKPWIVPTFGLGLGFLFALLVALLPSPAQSPAEMQRAAEAIAMSKIAPVPQPRTSREIWYVMTRSGGRFL